MKNRLPPGPAAGSGRAPVVEAHHDVSVLSEHLMPQVVPTPPAIEHGLAGRLAVDMDQQGILRIRIKVRRKDAPTVKGDAVADVDPEELRSSFFQCVDLALERLVF